MRRYRKPQPEPI